ncbi:hypothetical protein B296_00013443 [Ensete ventricosum]|uniref:Uncharacterized protein n=1 Tax=Ensete ventricosum TaxID=4639 RepID=A0A426XWW6_ENSVE|nr:hypothetical protein B296_00013443 [Ensete ventricosum]
MQWELVERLTGSSPKVSEAYREFNGSSPKVIGSLPGRHREFTGRRPRDLLEDRRRLPKSLLGVDDCTTQVGCCTIIAMFSG